METTSRTAIYPHQRTIKNIQDLTQKETRIAHIMKQKGYSQGTFYSINWNGIHVAGKRTNVANQTR